MTFFQPNGQLASFSIPGAPSRVHWANWAGACVVDPTSQGIQIYQPATPRSAIRRRIARLAEKIWKKAQIDAQLIIVDDLAFNSSRVSKTLVNENGGLPIRIYLSLLQRPRDTIYTLIQTIIDIKASKDVDARKNLQEIAPRLINQYIDHAVITDTQRVQIRKGEIKAIAALVALAYLSKNQHPYRHVMG
jgi:hypothetical protein